MILPPGRPVRVRMRHGIVRLPARALSAWLTYQFPLGGWCTITLQRRYPRDRR